MVRDYDGAVLEVFSLAKAEKGDTAAVFEARGHYYFPEISGELLTVLEFNDPNPAGQHRKDTVMAPKLPVTNKVVTFRDFKQVASVPVAHASEVICAARSGDCVFYLHNDKFITAYGIHDQRMYEYDCRKHKSSVACIEKHKEGVIFSSAARVLTYLHVTEQGLQAEEIKVDSPAVNGNLCLKVLEDGTLFGFNEAGLHLYEGGKTHTLQLFEITNCGLAVSKDASLLAVGDFSGNVLVYPTSNFPAGYEPLFRTCVAMPVRALGWIDATRRIAIGTTEGGLYVWDYEGSTEATLVRQFEHSLNCMEVGRGHLVVGTSHGDIVLFDERTLEQTIEHKAHTPIHYEDKRQRELFGSLGKPLLMQRTSRRSGRLR